MSSKMDRNSIDMSRFIDSINTMNEYADKKIPKQLLKGTMLQVLHMMMNRSSNLRMMWLKKKKHR